MPQNTEDKNIQAGWSSSLLLPIRTVLRMSIPPPPHSKLGCTGFAFSLFTSIRFFSLPMFRFKLKQIKRSYFFALFCCANFLVRFLFSYFASKLKKYQVFRFCLLLFGFVLLLDENKTSFSPCAASEHICLKQPVLPLDVCLFYSSLFCPWKCLDYKQPVLPFDMSLYSSLLYPWRSLCVCSTAILLSPTGLNRNSFKTDTSWDETGCCTTDKSRGNIGSCKADTSKGSTCCYRTDTSKGSTGFCKTYMSRSSTGYCITDTSRQHRLLYCRTDNSRGSTCYCRTDMSRGRTDCCTITYTSRPRRLLHAVGQTIPETAQAAVYIKDTSIGRAGCCML